MIMQSSQLSLPEYICGVIQYSGMTHDDVDEIHSIEMGVYNTNDEVPSKLFKHNLIRYCPELCMVARCENDEIVGAMYGGLIKGPSISNDKISMDFIYTHRDRFDEMTTDLIGVILSSC